MKIIDPLRFMMMFNRDIGGVKFDEERGRIEKFPDDDGFKSAFEFIFSPSGDDVNTIKWIIEKDDSHATVNIDATNFTHYDDLMAEVNDIITDVKAHYKMRRG